jgi:hypothetical protein
MMEDKMAVDVVKELELIMPLHGGACMNEIRSLLKRIEVEGSEAVVVVPPEGSGDPQKVVKK